MGIVYASKNSSNVVKNPAHGTSCFPSKDRNFEQLVEVIKGKTEVRLSYFSTLISP